MFSRLWPKVALVLVGMTLSIILITSLVINYIVAREFQGYVKTNQNQTEQRLGRLISETYVLSGGWDPYINQQISHWATMMGVHIRVTDTHSNLVAETPHLAADNSGLNRLASPGPKYQKAVPVTANAQRIGTLYLSFLGEDGMSAQDLAFKSRMNTSLIWTAAAAGLLAFLLSFWLSRRLTYPLLSMAKTATKLKAGNLKERTAIDSRDELGELSKSLNHLAESLERQETLRKHLTADIAHELRTPLATVQSYIEALLDGVMPANQKSIQSIHEEILRLTRLVQNIEQLALMENEGLRLNLGSVDVPETLKRLQSTVKPLFDEKKIKLRVSTKDRVPKIRADSDRVSQIFLNLLINAHKYTPEGGRVSVNLASEDSGVEVVFKDSGVGIPSCELPYVFERFYRGDKSRSRDSGGSGLGLTIAKELTEAHGGHIRADSKAGEGAEFRVYLPSTGPQEAA